MNINSCKLIAMKKESSLVLLERRQDGIALITLNRPAVCNAINAAVTRQLQDIAATVEADPSIQVAILCGAGEKGFCSGADLREVAHGDVAQLSTSDGGFAGFTRLKKDKVWIAAVHGATVAGGLEIMLACDFAIAADNAMFALPEVKWGLIASEGGLYRLPRSIPKPLAMEMILSGEPIQAPEALHYGLVNRVVAAQELINETMTIARKISVNAPLAVRHSKALAQQAYDISEADSHKLGREALTHLQGTDDFYEGPRAFIERRTPIWKGR